MKKIALSIAVALAFPPTGLMASDVPVAERPTYHAGDAFDYVERFQTVPCRHWQVADLDDGGMMVTRCDDNVAYFAADTGALVRIVGKSGRDLLKFQPFSPPIPFPLRVGLKWDGRFRLTTTDTPVSPDLTQHCEAKSYETITVAAGTMPAFRVECTTTWSVWPLHGTVTVTSWYAPAAKTVVRTVNSSDPKWNLELAGFSAS